jgi:hypothetical protein
MVSELLVAIDGADWNYRCNFKACPIGKLILIPTLTFVSKKKILKLLSMIFFSKHSF